MVTNRKVTFVCVHRFSGEGRGRLEDVLNVNSLLDGLFLGGGGGIGCWTVLLVFHINISDGVGGQIEYKLLI